MAQRVATTLDVLIHGDEPLRRVAEDHRLLRAPGMRIIVAQPPTGDECVCVDECLDNRFVGVSEIALVVDHALAFEAWRLFGEIAIGINGEGNCRIYLAIGKQPLVRSPDLEVFATVARRRVYKAGARILDDMLASKEGYLEIVAATVQGMLRQGIAQHVARHITEPPPVFDASGSLDVFREGICNDQSVADLCPIFLRSLHNLIESVRDRVRVADRSVPRNRPRRGGPDHDVRTRQIIWNHIAGMRPSYRKLHEDRV